jgi:hypothetical protein
MSAIIGHRRLSGVPGEHAVMAHVGVEEDVVGRQRLWPQFRPGLRDLQADGGQLAGQRLNGRVRAVQDDGLRAAKVRDADRRRFMTPPAGSARAMTGRVR